MKVAEPDDYSIVSRFLSPSLFMNVTPSLMIALLLLLLFVSLYLFMKVAVRDDRAMHGQDTTSICRPTACLPCRQQM